MGPFSFYKTFLFFRIEWFGELNYNSTKFISIYIKFNNYNYFLIIKTKLTNSYSLVELSFLVCNKVKYHG